MHKTFSGILTFGVLFCPGSCISSEACHRSQVTIQEISKPLLRLQNRLHPWRHQEHWLMSRLLPRLRRLQIHQPDVWRHQLDVWRHHMLQLNLRHQHMLQLNSRHHHMLQLDVWHPQLDLLAVLRWNNLATAPLGSGQTIPPCLLRLAWLTYLPTTEH